MLMPLASEPELNVDCLVSEHELVALRDDWNLLAGQMPMRSYEWAVTWWQHYRTQRTSLCVLVVRDESGSVIGIAPWYQSDTPLAGQVIRFLGSGEVCADYLSLLCEDEHRQLVVDALRDFLTTTYQDWDVIELTAVESDDAAVGELSTGLAFSGHEVDVRSRWNGWRVELPADWPTFLTQLSKSRRERTRKLERQNLASGRARLRPIASQQELDSAFDLLVELHQKRRASVGEAGCFRSVRFSAFHRQLCHELLGTGQLRFLVLELDRQPIAAEYSLTSDDTVYYYQGGFDPGFADERPGWLSFAASLKLAIEQGYRYYDFLRGDEPYKASWRAKPIALNEVRIVGRHRSARLRHSAWLTGQTTKQWLKRQLRRRQPTSLVFEAEPADHKGKN